MDISIKKSKGFPHWPKLLSIGLVLTAVVFVTSSILLMNSNTRNKMYSDNFEETSINYGGMIKQDAPRMNEVQKTSPLYNSEGLSSSDTKDSIENTKLKSSNIEVQMNADYAKRGLVYEPSFNTKFSAEYILGNESSKNAYIEFEFPFPQGSTEKEVSGAIITVDGVEVKNSKRKSTENKTTYSLFWEGEIPSRQDVKINIVYETVGLSRFNYEGIENESGAQDFYLKAKIIGTRDYDNTGALSIDERNYLSEDIEGKKTNGIELVWDKPSLFTKPNIAFSIANKVNPSEKLSSIYMFMTPLYIGFMGALILASFILKRHFGGSDMLIISILFIVFFPFLHYLTSFTIDPSVEIVSNVESAVDFSMPLYGAFAIALSIIGGLIFYLLIRILKFKASVGLGIPSIFLFMGFFPLALTIPEYKGLLVLIGIVAILAVVVQLRVLGKLTRKVTEPKK